MKQLIFFIFLFLTVNAIAQKNSGIQNTSWKGIIEVPRPTNVVFEFLPDTLNLKVNNNVFEKMTYVVKADSIFIHKVYGASPCESEALMVWTYTIKDDKLNITTVSDDCPARSGQTGQLTVYTRYQEKLKMDE